MPVTLKSILKLSSMSKLKLIAGRKGLDKVITRPLIGHIDYISDAYGGELLFITEAGFRADEGTLKSLISESNFNNLSGIVFSVPCNYIPVVNENVIFFADSLCFPLFQMPWDSMLSEIIKNIESYIRKSNNEDKLLHILMEKIICADPNETYDIKKQIARLGYNSTCAYQTAVIKISGSQATIPNYEKHLNYIHLYIRNILNQRFCGSMTMSQRDELVILAPVNGGTNFFTELKGICDSIITHFPGIHLNLDVWKSTNGADFSQKSLEVAENVIKKCPKPSDYEIFNLFRDVLGYKKIQNFCDKNIGKLINYDKHNNSELIHTIEVYFENRFNVSRTANDLMIHRNSLMYRLRRIEEIIGRKLDDPYVLLDVIISVYIKKTINI